MDSPLPENSNATRDLPLDQIDFWQQAADLALRLPGRGHRSVRVTRIDTGEYVAVALVSTTTGAGVEECAAGLGRSCDEALAARLRGGAP